ncbi:MAG: YigZ family protein [Chitinophagaceae bacterium]
MQQPNFYHTIELPSVAEYKDRGSKFLGFAFPIETVGQFKERLKVLKEEHIKAAHHCFAYRIGLDKNNFRTADDREPAGTAGKVILGQIDSRALCNVGIVVVRYFGGTLLGVPALANAYKTVSSLALQLTPIIQKPVLVIYQLSFDYTLMNEVMMIVKRSGCTVMESKTLLFCNMSVALPRSTEEECLQQFRTLHGLEITLVT